MNRIKSITIIVLAVLLSGNLFAQRANNDSLKSRAVQFTFFSPLGTNGLEAGKIENNLSLNLIAGYAGGLKGVEFAGFANVITRNATGIQLAGFSNTVWQDFMGVQYSGFSNVTRGNHTMGQISGFSNVTGRDFKGLQMSGFSSFTGHQFDGIQTAGFSNIVGGKFKGIQISGFSNIAKGGADGIQISGFSNIAAGNSKAVQVASFANLATDTLEGVQISGFVNVAQSVKGMQMAFLNLADTFELGVPIGFASIVRKGYHEIEIGTSESFYLDASFKTGVAKFYNIFSAGMKIKDNNLVWGFGYGVGTQLALPKEYAVNIDLINFSVGTDKTIAESKYWDFDNLTKLEVTVSKQFFKNLAVYGGPTLNFAISDRADSNGHFTGSAVVPYSMYSSNGVYTKYDFYPGFKAGLRF